MVACPGQNLIRYHGTHAAEDGRVGRQSISLCVADRGSPASANCVDACLAAEPESTALHQTLTDRLDSTCANACN